MNLVGLQKRLVYLLLAIPFSALLVGGEMNPLIVVLVVGSGVVSWFWEPPRVDLDRWDNVITGLSLAVLVLTGARLVSGEGVRIEPLVDLVLMLTCAKLMQRRGPRDYVQLMALSFLLMTAATAFNEGLAFALAFLSYTVLGTMTLAVKHLNEEMTEHHPQRLRSFAVEWSFLGVVASLAVAVCVLAGGLFLVFPRLGVGFFSTESPSSVMTSGFSEEVELGRHGSIRDNDSIVMRVEFPDHEGPVHDSIELRWRALALDEYDGQSWTNTVDPRGRAWQDDNGVYLRDENFRYPEGTVRQLIHLMPINTEYLFALPALQGIGFPDEDPDLGRGIWREQITITRTGHARFERDQGLPTRYEAYSYDSDFYGGREWAYRQTPEVLSDRFHALSREVAGETNDLLRAAQNIEDYLRQELSYTTDLPEVSRDNPIESFLFDTRAGHCEYFATAMVLMARSVGLPARNVNGYLGGDWNPIGGYYAVRQSHAHSWVEVFIPGRGWLTFDPTPASGIPAASDPTVWASVAGFVDNLRMIWYEHVIDYDLERQISAARAIAGTFGGGSDFVRSAYMKARVLFFNLRTVLVWALLWTVASVTFRMRSRRVRHWTRTDSAIALVLLVASTLTPLWLWWPDPGPIVIGVGALVPVVIVLGAWAARRSTPSTRKRRRKRRFTRASQLWLRAVRGLVRVGYDYANSDTPAQLLAQVESRSAPYGELLARVIGRYQGIRFGNEVALDALRELKRDVSELERALKAERRAVRRRRAGASPAPTEGTA